MDAEAACASGKVRAGEAACTAQPAGAPTDELWLWAPRALFAVPRLVFRVATGPLVVLRNLDDEHHLTERIDRLLWNDPRTVGVIPSAFYETGFGPNVGLRLIHTNLGGKGERLLLRGGFGGVDNQIYLAQLHSGHRFFDARHGLSLRYRRHRGGRFYGVGDLDLGQPPPVDMPFDALSSPHAVRTRYDVEQAELGFSTHTTLQRPFSLRLAQLVRVRNLSTRDERSSTPYVDRVFTRESLFGIGRTGTVSYTELSLTLDSRVSRRRDMPRRLPSSGWYASAWGGVQIDGSENHPAFGRVGLDVQPFFDLLRGDRVLRLRLRVSSVLGSLSHVPIIDLPALGGSRLLRGYASQRFTGRVTTLWSAEYRYPLQEGYTPYLFVDAGRAYASWDALRASGLLPSRLGFGFGLMIYNQSDVSLRFQLASSLEGGAVLLVTLDGTDELAGAQ